MTGFLLAFHVLGVILTIGKVGIAASTFPPAMYGFLNAPGGPGNPAIVRVR